MEKPKTKKKEKPKIIKKGEELNTNNSNKPMKIYQSGKLNPNLKTIFIDVDDVILYSRGAALNILNKRYNLNKTTKDIKDWGFRSITRQCTQNEILEIFESDEFWSTVEPHYDLIDFLEKDSINPNRVYNNFNWIMITKRTEKNLDKKFDYLFNSGKIPFFKAHKNEIGYYGLSTTEDKKYIRMMSGIQIDDFYPNLKSTEASIKILLRNEIDTNYNDVSMVSDNLQNLYVVENLQQLFETLTFIKDMELEDLDDFNFVDDLDDFEIDDNHVVLNYR